MVESWLCRIEKEIKNNKIMQIPSERTLICNLDKIAKRITTHNLFYDKKKRMVIAIPK